jgi:enoyl-[acyl-carrier protein] reductase II
MALRITTKLTELLEIEHPIIQDGMGGGPLGTARLAAAVSNAGGLGTLSTPYMMDDGGLGQAIRGEIDDALALTDRPLAFNVPVGTDRTGKVLSGTRVGLNSVLDYVRNSSAARGQIRAITTSGGSPEPFSAAIHESGLIHIHKCGSPRHAQKAEACGADIIMASGHEMGGHTLAVPISTLVLAPEVIARVSRPVVVSGGICSGRGLAAALAMGGCGVAMGTRFVCTADHDWHDNVMAAIMKSNLSDTVLMRAMYGPSRFLKSKATDELKALYNADEMSEDGLSNWKEAAITRAYVNGDMENGLLTVGEVAAVITDRPSAKDLIDRMVDEAIAAIEAVSSQVKHVEPDSK